MKLRLALAAAAVLALPAFAQGKITLAANWKAQAAHGGLYLAVADGTDKKYALNLTIQPGGPQVNRQPLLPARPIDYLMTGKLLHSFDNMKSKPDRVQRVVDPSAIGWVNSLHGNRNAANTMMIKDKPEMTTPERTTPERDASEADPARMAPHQFANKGVGQDLKARLIAGK